MYHITQHSKDMIAGTLHDSAMIIAAIPDKWLTPDMQHAVNIAIANIRTCEMTLENLTKTTTEKPTQTNGN